MDQQFRLKWNNHCNTLLQVFGNLLKTETLVDCTIGADGQYLKAHKVVVSACSPYFQSLFTEHFDKHPIIILKDIKFAELQSMIDYMYEGEVNISQDQLPSFLKAAASIQLKGLTQNVKSEAAGGPGGGGAAPHSPPASNKPPVPSLNSAASRGGMLSNGSLTPSSMLNVELEEGQQRKKRKLGGGPPAEPSSASSSPSLLVPDLVTPSVILDVPGETPGGAQNGQGAGGQGGGNNEAAGGGGHMKKEPSEYSGRSEDEEEDGMSHDGWDLSNDGLHDSNSTMSAGDRGQGGPGGLHHSTPGGHRPSGGPGGLAGAGGPDMSNVDENNQAYAAMMAEYQRRQIVSQFFNHKHQVFSTWKEDINIDDMSHFITSSPSPNAKFNNNNNNGDSSSPGDPLGNSFHGGVNNRRTRSEDARWECPQCGKRYKYSRGLAMHRRLECGKEPMFHCPYCPQKCHQKGNMVIHIKKKHPEKANPLQ